MESFSSASIGSAADFILPPRPRWSWLVGLTLSVLAHCCAAAALRAWEPRLSAPPSRPIEVYWLGTTGSPAGGAPAPPGDLPAAATAMPPAPSASASATATERRIETARTKRPSAKRSLGAAANGVDVERSTTSPSSSRAEKMEDPGSTGSEHSGGPEGVGATAEGPGARAAPKWVASLGRGLGDGPGTAVSGGPRGDEAWVAPLLAQLRQRLEAGRDYPRIARRLGLEGTVTLRARIETDGSVRSWDIAVPSPHPVLDEAALDAAEQIAAVDASGTIPRQIVVVVPLRFVLRRDSSDGP